MSKIYIDKTIQDMKTEKYSLYQREDGYKVFVFEKVAESSGGWHFSDDDSYIKTFTPELETISGESILIIGLGFGLMPYYIKNNFNTIDVLEIDSDLISIISSQNLLSENTNLICGDALTYNFSDEKKWDYIIVDVFFEKPDNYFIELYKQKFLSKLNANGFLYMPIFEQKFFNT